jgi:hypothetical protein
LWSGKVAGTRAGGRYAVVLLQAVTPKILHLFADGIDGGCNVLQRRHTCNFQFAFVNGDGGRTTRASTVFQTVLNWHYQTLRLVLFFTVMQIDRVPSYTTNREMLPTNV